MKLIVERTHLLAALKAVGHLADSKAKVLVLSHVRLRTEGSRLFIAATDNNAWAEAEIPAEVERPGETTINADTLQRMVTNFAEGAQIYIDAGDTLATVRAGRSRYQPHVLPASDFPAAFAPKGKAATFTLLPEEVKRLFALPKSAAAKGRQDRAYLEGVYLHTTADDATLWGAACDGYVLLAADVPAPEGAANLPKLLAAEADRAGRPRGLMVPLESVGHLIKLGESGLEIRADTNILAASAGLPSSAVKISYATRLIENRFPAYEQAVPPLEGSVLTVEAGAFSAAVKRLADMAGNDERAVAIEWGEDGDLSLWLDDHADGIYGSEAIEIEKRSGVGRLGIRSGFVMKAVDAVGRGHLEIWFTGEDKPVRIRNVDDPSLIAVVWLQVLRRRPEQGAVLPREEAA
ncbi:DNA polymerase III subunit beta [Ancylobacter sp. VNQ12]|uniref:DNA polymerase III subunit beta n=1 Tax=Ancylobacter sp. VNQ12 TaxID=3400920 RepID=UPI003C025EEC